MKVAARLVSAVEVAWNATVDACFRCFGVCCGARRLSWFRMAEGLRG